MSHQYYTTDGTPVFKFLIPNTAVATAAWTPQTSMRVAITSAQVACNNSGGGTFQLRFGNVSGDVITQGWLSTLTTGYLPTVGIVFPTPVVSPIYDRVVFFETSANQSVNGWTCALQGYEY